MQSGSKLRRGLCTRKEKEAEKERLRKEKEAQKAEKEAQRERQRLEKEVEMGSAHFARAAAKRSGIKSGAEMGDELVLDLLQATYHWYLNADPDTLVGRRRKSSRSRRGSSSTSLPASDLSQPSKNPATH